jgi:predicted nucleic acid-binding protein
MICFDTNIIIYLGNKTLNGNITGDTPPCYASITIIEALGFMDIRASEAQRIKELLDTMIQIPLDASVIAKAVQLRRFKRLSLGDAIVAATALEHDCVLYTANTEDFKHIEGLRLHNPLKEVL